MKKYLIEVKKGKPSENQGVYAPSATLLSQSKVW